MDSCTQQNSIILTRTGLCQCQIIKHSRLWDSTYIDRNSYIFLGLFFVTAPILGKKKKVKCTLAQALRLCTGCMAHMESRDIALLFHDHSTRRGWGVSVMPRPLFTPGKDTVPIVQEAGWAPGLVWTGAENLTPTGIRSPDRPARSQSLYRLRYLAHPILGLHN